MRLLLTMLSQPTILVLAATILVLGFPCTGSSSPPTYSMEQPAESELEGLQKGPIVYRDSPDYEERVNQYAYSSHKEDMSPRYIIAPTDDLDVKAVLQYASKNGISVAVRTGGHQYSGASSSKDGILLDLESTFQEFIADDDGTVIMGISCKLGDLNARLAKRGLFVPHGQCTHVHVGGHAHTGGYSSVSRAFGLFGDHITAIKIITADGQCRWIERGANNTEDADLFWAVLGGSPGNYAVLTHIKLKTHRSDAHPHARGLQLVLPYSTDSMRTLLEVVAGMTGDPNLPADFDLSTSVISVDWPSLDLPPSALVRSQDYTSAMEKVEQDILRAKKITNRMAFYQKLGLSKEEFGKFTQQFDKQAGSKRLLGFEKPGFIVVWANWGNLDGKPESEQATPPGPWFDRLKEIAGSAPLKLVDEWHGPEQGMAFLTGKYTFPITREFAWPYNKRTYLTNKTDLATSGWMDVMLDRIGAALDGWVEGARTVVQPIPWGGTESRFISSPAKHDTAYSWRNDTSMVLVTDMFYVDLPFFSGKDFADTWIAENDRLFKGPDSTFAPNIDRRVLWGSYAATPEEKSLDAAWPLYHETAEKYKRLQDIKTRVDPNNVLTPNAFAIRAVPQAA